MNCGTVQLHRAWGQSHAVNERENVSKVRSEVRSSNTVAAADSWATWSHFDWPEQITKGRINGIKIGDYERTKSRASRFMGFECLLYFSVFTCCCPQKQGAICKPRKNCFLIVSQKFAFEEMSVCCKSGKDLKSV